MKVTTAATRIINDKQLKQLQEAGISLIWTSEKHFLLWAANNQEQQELTYKQLDKLQEEAQE